MALSDKNIIITPNIGSANDPKIVFSGADASTAAQNITLTAYPTNGGTLSFDGSAGQLFSVTNSMSGTIFSANDVSGIPSIEVLDTGLVKVAQYSGNVLLGSGTDNGVNKLQLIGSLSVNSSSYPTNYPTSLGVRADASGDLRLGNNANNDMIAGTNVAGGYFRFYTNNTNAYPTLPNGTLSLTINSTTVNSAVALQQGGNQVLHAGNYGSYALPLSGGNMSGNLGRTAHAAGFQVGSYNSVGENSGKSSPIYTIGSSYNPTDTAIGGMYGIGYSHSNFFGNNGGATSWGLYVVGGGTYSAIFTLDGAWVKNTLFSIAGNTALHAGNYTSYSPTLTGGSASGTWGISITGNAAALSSANYITRTGSYGSTAVNFQNTPAGTYRYQGDDNGLGDQPGSGGSWWHYEHMRHSNGGGYWGTTIAWGWEDAANSLAVRNVRNGSFESWRYYLNSGNYNSYAPTLTGGGASGTWGISITGNAATATTATNAAGAFTVPGALTIGNTTSSDIYMVDTDEGTRRIHCNSNRIGFLNQSDGWGSYCNDDGSWTSDFNITAYSDIKLKENIVTIDSALSKTLSLRGVFYNRIDKDDKTRKVGVIAQEIQEVLPEVVRSNYDKTDDSTTLSVDYGNISALLIEAIKEQQTIIDSQESRIARLETLVSKLIEE